MSDEVKIKSKTDVKKIAKGPYLIIASGLFYYFPKDQIIEFLRKVKNLGNVEI